MKHEAADPPKNARRSGRGRKNLRSQTEGACRLACSAERVCDVCSSCGAVVACSPILELQIAH